MIDAAAHDTEILVRRFTAMRASLLGYLRVLVRDAHLAEDIYQETCLVVLRRIGDIDAARDFEAWVRGIAANLARNACRKAGRLNLLPSPDLCAALERAHTAGDEEETPRFEARLEHLHDCMQGLTGRQRQLLALRYRDGASLAGVARATGRSAGGVQVTLSRLRQLLLECIERKGRAGAHG